MERITLVLHVSLALLVALAGLIFGLAESRSGIPLLTVPLAGITLFLVDRWRIWRIPPRVQNLLALAAFAAAAVELLLNDVEAPLLAGGHLLTYLTAVHLLQEKESRQVWWLAALSLLQVAVASLLTYSSWYGLVTPVFLLLTVWTLAVFQLHSTVRETDRSAAKAWSAAGRELSFRDRWLGPGEYAPAPHLDEQLRGLFRPFCSVVMSGTVLAVLLAGAFFLLIPRVWLEATPIYFEGGRPIGGAPSRTGYTSHVSLGHMGPVQESPRVALEARLFDKQADAPVPWTDWQRAHGGSIRFRGAVQELYEGGAWRRWEGADASRFRLDALFPGAVSRYRQDVRVFYDSTADAPRVVFASGLASRCVAPESRRRIEVEPTGWTLYAVRLRQVDALGNRTRESDAADYQIDVALGDLPFPNQYGVNFGALQFNSRFHLFYLNTALIVPEDVRERLRQWIARRPRLTASGETGYALARRWESEFIDGTELTYSLNLTVSDPEVDPVIDFLENTRRGHCEYFASALALLLRTQGIPTRVVTGYKGGQMQDDGRLVVRDLHAHLWLEAYVEDAPEDPVTGQFGPRWITLDPTPAARDAFVLTQEQQSLSVWSRMQEVWSSAWSGSIRMNQRDQQVLIYEPLQSALTESWEAVREAVERRAPWELLRPITSPREWFSWRGGLAVFLLLWLLSGFVWLVQKTIAFARRRRESALARNAPAATPGFFDRLQSVLARYGVRRPPADTPREFAASIEFLSRQPLPSDLPDAARELTERFYSVRFGGRPLSETEAADIVRRIERWEAEQEARLAARRR